MATVINTDFLRTHRSQAVSATKLHPYLVVLGAVGIATIFLPFTSDYSPLTVILKKASDWYPLVGSFFLAIPIAIASASRLWTGSLWRPVWLSAYGLALAMAGVTTAILSLFFFDLVGEDLLYTDWPFAASVTLLPALVLALGVGCVNRNWRHKLPHAFNAVIAMQVAYVANAVLCLALFFEEGFFSTGWQIGAYVTLVTVIVYLVHIALLSVTRFAATPR